MRLRKRPIDCSLTLSSTNRSMASSILASSTSRSLPRPPSMRLLRRRQPRTIAIFLKSENALWISLRSSIGARLATENGRERERMTRSSGRVQRMSKSYRLSSLRTSPRPVISSRALRRRSPLRRTQWAEQLHSNNDQKTGKVFIFALNLL